MREIWKIKDGESLLDYEERLYRNRAEYGLEWSDVNNLLNLEQHPDNTRKCSYGYLKRVDQERNNTFDKSVMIINDLHLPFERDDVIEIINKHASEINTLVIAGDLMDCKSISFFPDIKSLSLEEELIYTYNFMKKIRKILNNNQRIIIINGNHEERFYRDICDMHKKEMQKMINPNLIDMIVEGFTIYDDGKKKKFDGIKDIEFIPHWYINLENKIIVAHPKDFSRVDGKMCEKTSEYFLNQKEDFEVVVFGHTHKYTQMKVSRRQGVYVVENGCLCKPHKYSDKGKLGYTPQDYCYTIIKYNNDEKIDFNNINVYHLDDLEESKENYLICL